jgi:phosphatidate phosphatase LPIN
MGPSPSEPFPLSSGYDEGSLQFFPPVRSDALGHVFTMIGRDWTHLGVAKLYTDICRNGYKIMYLTSRAIGQADSTRYYLKGIKQNDYQLPEGPVIMSPDRLMASLHR